MNASRSGLGLLMLLAGVALAGMGCSSRYKPTGEAFEPLVAPASQGVVYVYLLPGRRGTTYTLEIDGKEAANIGPGAYYAFASDPGTVKLTTKVHIPGWRPAIMTRALAGEKETTVEVEAGRTYYLRGSIHENPGAEEYDLVLDPVDEVVGSAEVELCQLAN